MIDKIKMRNTVTLSILLYGTTIVETEIGGKTWFCLTAGNKMDNINKEDIYKSVVMAKFPTKKGALGYCKRRNIKINEEIKL